MSFARNAEDDLKQSLKFVYPLLRIVGAWPTPVSASLSSKIIERCLIFLSYFLLFLFLVPGILHILVRETNSRRQLKLFMPHINVMCQLFKYTIVLHRMDEFRQMLAEIKREWLDSTEENRQVFRDKAQIGHKVIIVIMLTIYTGGVSYRTILPLSVGRIVLPDNTTIRLLPCPSYFVFFDEQSTPYYELIFTLQVLSGFFTYTIVCGTVGICTVLCLHTCGQLRILANKMTELTNQTDTSEDAVQKKIVDIVEYRTKIKRFLKSVEQISPYLCFFEIINDTGVVCTIGYCIIMEWQDSNATAILIYLLLQMNCVFINFSMCYVGQLLIDESEYVKKVSATLNWYRFPTKKARYLILVIIMSNYNMKLTAGKVVDISLATFTDIMKASMGYLNVLRGTF